MIMIIIIIIIIIHSHHHPQGQRGGRFAGMYASGTTSEQKHVGCVRFLRAYMCACAVCVLRSSMRGCILNTLVGRLRALSPASGSHNIPSTSNEPNVSFLQSSLGAEEMELIIDQKTETIVETKLWSQGE